MEHKPTHTQMYLTFSSSQINHCKRNIQFCLAQRICSIAENNTGKLKNLKNLKRNLLKYHYPDSLTKQEIQNTPSIPQKYLQKPKFLLNKNILPVIRTFNLNNPDIYATIEFLVTCLKNCNASSFHNIRLMESNRQFPNLKKAFN